MSIRQTRTLLVILSLGLLYFIAFIPVNLMGARDANMLALFEVDEYAQYPHVLRMLQPGETPYQTLRNFLIYLHYFYGYPFYFFSALALMPLRANLGAGWENQTQQIVLILRQMINVLPMLAAVGLLVYLQTRLRSWWRSAGLFIFLLACPATVVNNFWWHPDSLVFFFIVLTFFFLDRDDLRFGKYFWLAAAACGLAIGTKHLGIFFALAIPVYLIWGVIAGQLTWKKAVRNGALFILVMLTFIVISNPLLLLPQERAAILSTQVAQFRQTSVGILTANTSSFFEGGSYPEDFRIHYGEWFFVLLGFLALGIGIARSESRRLNVLILAWMIPLALVLLNVGTRRTHYFLPLILPLYSSLVHLFPETIPILKRNAWVALRSRTIRLSRWLLIIPAIPVLFQLVLFIQTDVTLYSRQLWREMTSPSLAFYQRLQEVLKPLPQPPRIVYRDWRIYYPGQPGQQVEMNWDMATYPYIRDLKPDLILLERENLALFSKPEVIEQAANPGNMRLIHEFYRDAALNTVEGYRTIYQDSFASALVSQVIFDQYFKNP